MDSKPSDSRLDNNAGEDERKGNDEKLCSLTIRASYLFFD